MKRLQFRHHDEIFNNRSLALEFFSNIVDLSHTASTVFGKSLYAEPMVAKPKCNKPLSIAVEEIMNGDVKIVPEENN